MLRFLLSSLLLLALFESTAQAKMKKSMAYTGLAPAPMSVSPVTMPKSQDVMPRPAIGFQGGMGLGQTTLSEGGTMKEGNSDRQTFGGGIYFDFPVSRYFTLSPELLYVSKGMSATMPTGVTEFRFDFIELPVLAKVHFMTGEFRPYVFAGPSVGIPLSKSSTLADGTVSNVDGGGLVDLSAQVGLGAEINLGGNVGLVFSGRYVHGFVDQTTDANQEIFNRTFLFMAGFRVGL